jgi:putative thioredoxin
LPGSEPAEQIRLLEEFLDGNPDQPEARLQLAGLKALSDPASALQLLDHIKMGEPGYDLKDDIETIQELGAVSGNGDSLDATLFSAAEALRSNRYAEAAEQIIDVVGKDKSIHKELPRRAGVALFHLLGDQHPVTKKYRRIFDMWLY